MGESHLLIQVSFLSNKSVFPECVLISTSSSETVVNCIAYGRNECFFFSLMFENQSITDFVFLHWLELVLDRMLLLILSSTYLLSNPRLFFAGLINLHFGLFLKFSLWFLREINARLCAIFSTLSFTRSLAVIWFSSRLMLSLVWSSAFHDFQISNLKPRAKVCFQNF